MKTKKLNIFLNKRLWVALIAATLVCVAIAFSVLAEDNIDTSASSKNRIIFPDDRPEGINKEYEIYDKATLVAADLALLRWNAMGNNADNSNDKIIGVFGEEDQTKEKYYGYWDVYEQVYARLLTAEGVIEKSTTNNITIGNVTSGTTIVKFTKGGRNSITANLTGETTVKGTLIILAEDNAALVANEYSTYFRFVINEGGTLVIQGPRGKKITFSDSGKYQKSPRGTTSFINVQEGNLYLNNCILDSFKFNALYKSTICFPTGNKERHLYMANSTMQNVSSENYKNTSNNYHCETGGILCMVYNDDEIVDPNDPDKKIIDPENNKAEASTLYINQCTFSQCNINSKGTVGGGAIRSYAADRCDLYVYNSTFSDNKCQYDENNTGKYNDNYTSGGGAIYWKSANGEATLSGCTFSGNYAAKVGGAIYNTGQMTIIGCKFIENNKAGDSGGAIAVEPPNTSADYPITPTTGSLTLDANTEIIGNTATNRGGGIYFNARSSAIGANDIIAFRMTLTINGAKIKNNSAKYGGGVAMWLNYGSLNYTTGITIQSTSEIEGNNALVEGGAIWMNSADDCQCIGNGGVTMESGTMSQNYAPSGGAVYIGAGTAATDMEFKMQGGTVSGNGVNAQGVTVTSNGGAIYMTRGTCTISGGTIDNCKATGDGGGVYLGGGNFALNHTLGTPATISNCTAGNNGGGVYLGAGTMTINGGIITNNTAQNGGGAYVNATTTDHGIFVTGGEISENTATNGGGLAVNNGVYKMSGGNIHNNTAYNLGGAIYVSATKNVDVDILSGTIQNNYAAVSGGALGVEGKADNVVFTITIGVNQEHPCSHDFDPGSDNQNNDCPIIQNNTALKTGGGIYITGSENAMLNVYCLVEEGNKAADGKCNGFDDPELQNVKCKSDFMMVEGGTVILTTAENPGDADDDDENGHISIKGSIHVTAGVMTIDGSISNPLIEGNITVDVENEEDFHDYRANDENEQEYFRIQYFENYTNESDGITSGQFTVILVKVGDNGKASHKILDALYFHEGSEIGGWWTDKEYTGTQYTVNETYSIEGDLKLYAKWVRISYTVYFNPGEGTVHGSMDPQIINRIADGVSSGSLKENQFKRDGYIFDGWSKTLGGVLDYRNQELITANITTETKVTLYARWTPCTHNSTNTDSGVTVTASFTYAGSENVITRTCSCNGYIQTAALTAPQGARYDGASHPAKLTVSATSVTDQNSPQPWDISDNNISYTGKKIDDEGNEKNEPVADPNTCRNAGYYTATLTYDGASASVTFKIDKATQSGPDKPDYKAEKRDGQGEERIYITPITDESLKEKLQYYIKWYNNTGTASSQIQNYSDSTIQGFELNASFTYYYVYVQYKGDDNHYPSVWVMADAVLFHDGKISITAYTGDGIVITSNELYTEPRELKITVSASDNYHLFDTQYVLTTPNGAAVLEIIASSLPNKSIIYTVRNIPVTVDSQTDYKIDITGAKLKVITTSAITSSEKFGPVSGTEATITRDSAYTAYFEIKNYDTEVYTAPKLSFSTTLPKDTTVILIDRSNGTTYYSYTASGSETAIPLTDFVQMGTAATKFTEPTTSLDKPLKYQVVVDFSDCQNPLAAGTIDTSITADYKVTDVNGNNVSSYTLGAPIFPSGTQQAKLTEPPSPSVSAESKGTKIDLTFNDYPTASATSSKWNNRVGALVLTTSDTLPVDARIISAYGGGQTTYYRNANGEFIIPLADFNINTLTLTLISDLFPSTEKKYTFNAELMYSNSLAGKAPSNGVTLVSPTEIIFTATPSAEPAIGILNKSELKPIYVQNESIAVSVNAENLPETTQLDLRLFYKDPEKEWIATNLRVAVTDLNKTYEIKLGENTGSYYIAFELRDSQDGIIMTDKYYFTVVKNDTPTAN